MNPIKKRSHMVKQRTRSNAPSQAVQSLLRILLLILEIIRVVVH